VRPDTTRIARSRESSRDGVISVADVVAEEAEAVEETTEETTEET